MKYYLNHNNNKKKCILFRQENVTEFAKEKGFIRKRKFDKERLSKSSDADFSKESFNHLSSEKNMNIDCNNSNNSTISFQQVRSLFSLLNNICL